MKTGGGLRVNYTHLQYATKQEEEKEENGKKKKKKQQTGIFLYL